jgi:hypothetical protein
MCFLLLQSPDPARQPHTARHGKTTYNLPDGYSKRIFAKFSAAGEKIQVEMAKSAAIRYFEVGNEGLRPGICKTQESRSGREGWQSV